MRSAVAPADGADAGERFERALEAAVTRYDGPAPLAAMIRYHFGYDAGSGGAPPRERVHARQVLHAAAEHGAAFEDALDAACAVEILYNSRLVHDDVAHGAATRFGRPAVWAAYGMAHGINAGDAMCALSYLTLFGSGARRTAERTVAMTRRLHAATLAMCAGQAEPAAPAGEDPLLEAARALGALAAGGA